MDYKIASCIQSPIASVVKRPPHEGDYIGQRIFTFQLTSCMGPKNRACVSNLKLRVPFVL